MRGFCLKWMVLATTLFGVATSVAAGVDLNAEAQALQAKGDWQALQHLADEWSISEPANAAPWFYLGLADDQLGQRSDAIAAYERSTALAPQA